MTGILIIAPGGLVPGTVLLMQNVLLGQTKVMQIRQRETLSHQGAITHEVCFCTAQLVIEYTPENNNSYWISIRSLNWFLGRI